MSFSYEFTGENITINITDEIKYNDSGEASVSQNEMCYNIIDKTLYHVYVYENENFLVPRFQLNDLETIKCYDQNEYNTSEPWSENISGVSSHGDIYLVSAK